MNEQTLKKHYKSIKYVECQDFNIKPLEDFPASQGYLLLEIIKRYKLPFKALGYHHNLVSIKTKKQAFLWRDTGIGATFLGIIDLQTGKVDIKDDEEKENNKDKKVYNSFRELNEEIQRRDYNNILGLKANITREDYYNFLEVLPPLRMGANYFILSEALTDERYYKFVKYESNNVFLCEVVKIEQEE